MAVSRSVVPVPIDGSIDLSPAFRNGLLRFAEDIFNLEHAAQFDEAIPTEFGAVTVPTYEYPISTPSLNTVLGDGWPFPQFLRLDRTLLLCMQQSLFLITEPMVHTADWGVAGAEFTMWDADVPVPTSEILNNGDFEDETGGVPNDWTVGANWTYSDTAFNITHAAGSAAVTAQLFADQAVSLQASSYYQVVVRVSACSAGSFRIVLGDGTPGTLISTPGDHLRYIECGSGTLDVEIVPTSDFVGTIDEISVLLLATDHPVTDGGGVWHGAGFQDDWFITNAKSFVYRIESNPHTPNGGSAYVVHQDKHFICSTLCNHDNRLVMAGLDEGDDDNWFEDADFLEFFDAWKDSIGPHVEIDASTEFDDEFLIWSDDSGGEIDTPFASFMAMLGQPPGYSDVAHFKPEIIADLESGRKGMLPLRYTGKPLMVKPLGDALIVYGERGISMCKYQPGVGYVEYPASTLGIVNRSAINGDEQEHVYVTSQLHLWKMKAGPNIEWIGLNNILSTLTAASIVVAFDSLERYFPIGDGTNAYCLTRTGAGKTNNVMTPTVLRSPGHTSVIGAPTVEDPLNDVVIKSNVISGQNDQALYHLSRLTMHSSGSAAWTAEVQYRVKLDTATEVTSATLSFDARGVARPKLLMAEGDVELTTEDPDNMGILTRWTAEMGAHSDQREGRAFLDSALT